MAYRTERISRRVCHAVAEYSFRTAQRIHGRVYGGPKWTVSPVYEGMLKEEMDAAAARHEDVPYEPQLIDATFALLISSSGARPRPAVRKRAASGWVAAPSSSRIANGSSPKSLPMAWLAATPK